MGTTKAAMASGGLPRRVRGLSTIEMLVVLLMMGQPAGYVGHKNLSGTDKPAAVPDKARPGDWECRFRGQGLAAPQAPARGAAAGHGLYLKTGAPAAAPCSLRVPAGAQTL